MANCVDCGTKLNFFVRAADGRCIDCHDAVISAAVSEIEEVRSQEEKASGEAAQRRIAEIESVLLTTESTSDLKILKRLEIVTAECAFGMNIFKDLFAGIRDIVGGRSRTVQETMRASRRAALFELKEEAYILGANAVVGVKLEYTDLSSGANMILLVASGTAVVIDKEAISQAPSPRCSPSARFALTNCPCLPPGPRKPTRAFGGKTVHCTVTWSALSPRGSAVVLSHPHRPVAISFHPGMAR